MRNILLCLSLFLFLGCALDDTQLRQQVDRYNSLSYAYRYSDIDSCLYYAEKAKELSVGYPDGFSEAHVNLSFVAYQQMQYDKALLLLDHVTGHSRNQIELLCAEVMKMKVSQRAGYGPEFYDNRNRALSRMQRIEEGFHLLTDRQKARVEHAHLEYHIISSTYSYYLGQDSIAKDEIRQIDRALLARQDSAQMLYYDYMLGSGGLLDGDSLSIVEREFDYLFSVYTNGLRANSVYFVANSLQSLAMMLDDAKYAPHLREVRPLACDFLARKTGTDEVGTADSTWLSIRLAETAIQEFRRYKDAYQTSCAYRTLGELYFSAGRYDDALKCYLQAKHILDTKSDAGGQIPAPSSILLSERLSLAYSALGDKPSSDYYRNQYLDMLDSTRQDLELDSRKSQLQHELRAIRLRLFTVILLIVLLFVLSRLLMRRMREHSRRNLDSLIQIHQSSAYQEAEKVVREQIEEYEEKTEEWAEKVQAASLKIDGYKCENAERRAKVSLVYSVVPFLDRIIASSNRLKDASPEEQHTHLLYIRELSEAIMHTNDVLTEWIQMRQGSLKLHVSAFGLQSVLGIIAKGHKSFEQKDIRLYIDPSDVEVRADKALTMFMINTLADNARKFTPQGGEVRIDVQPQDEYVEIGISDTGQGLSPSDVEILNTSKVYDPSKLGISDEGKGFGFGIMNCKGIINKYKKISSLFSVCDFGVSSELGRGSRFWFRLPRVLSVCLLLLFSVLTQGQSLQTLYDSLYEANVNGRFPDAIQYGEQAMSQLEKTASTDTLLLMNLHNEMAIVAQALNDWDLYEYHNSQCVRLHRLYTQDFSLSEYCQKMSQHRANGKVVYALLILFVIIVLVLFYFLFLRGRIRSDYLFRNVNVAMQEMLSVLTGHLEQEQKQALITSLHDKAMDMAKDNPHLQSAEETFYQQVSELLARHSQAMADCETEEERFNHASFEENRLYVQNQILDNCLSTIKHETMYYPARTLQMVEQATVQGASQDDISELSDFVHYYREVYMLLYTQACRQLDQNYFRLETISPDTLLPRLQKAVSRDLQRMHSTATFTVKPVGVADGRPLRGDTDLIQTMVLSLIPPLQAESQAIRLTMEAGTDTALFRLHFSDVAYDAETLDHLFDPSREHIPFLIARQILRDHDANCGHPGLRLYAQAEPDGACLIFTLAKGQKL